MNSSLLELPPCEWSNLSDVETRFRAADSWGVLPDMSAENSTTNDLPRVDRRFDDTLPTSLTLLQSVLAGSDRAWQVLVMLYSGFIYSKCRAKGLQDADAADIVQTVFSQLLASLATFKIRSQPGSFRKWLANCVQQSLRSMETPAG